ncbi:MAG TPA: acyl-ACP--UDP-N-acetylglucosamine O-acyltransferase [Polyangiaceae bacterium]|jgi:UDP-N-acetylglucosamine acyltransferase
MTDVHPSAIVDPRAELADDVVVGPFAIVEAGAVLSRGCVLHPHAVVRRGAWLGPGNVVHPFAVIGGAPQAKRPGAGEPRVEAGEGNVFREHVTVHGGTEGRTTRIGAANLFMVGAHVAHDVVVGSSCVLSNGAQLAGHAVVEDWVTFGGLSGVTQFVRVGESAFVAAASACEVDVPPFVIVQGDRARVRGVNLVGLARRGVPASSVAALRRAVRRIWLSRRTRAQALRELEGAADPYVERLLAALAGDAAQPKPSGIRHGHVA